MSEKAMSIEECLVKSGELFEKIQYKECKQLLLEYHSINYKASKQAAYIEYAVKTDAHRRKGLISNSTEVFKCIFEQNIYVCSFLEHMHNICDFDKGLGLVAPSPSSWQQGKAESTYKESCLQVISLCNSFNRLFREMNGWTISEYHTGLELVVLHNYLILYLIRLLVDLPEWPKLEGLATVCRLLHRAYEAITGYISSCRQGSYEDQIFDMLEGMLWHTENMSELTLRALSALCYSLFFVLFACNIFVPEENMKKIMSKVEVAYQNRKKRKHTGQNLLCLCPSDLKPSYKDLSELVLACNCLAAYEAHDAYTHLQSITYERWDHMIDYMKAFILFGEKQYDESHEICWTMWKKKQSVDGWMVSKLSNIIGCCLFKKRCYDFALRWFQRAVMVSEGSHAFAAHVPLWNIACTFHRLRKEDDALKALEQLAVSSTVSSSHHYSTWFCKNLWLENRFEMSHMQALYLVAHRSLACHSYSLSAKYFLKIMDLLRGKLLENLPHSMHFDIYLSDIFVEACYAFLLAERYEDCLEASNLASSDDFYFSIRQRQKSKTLFSWNDAKTVQKSSHFEFSAKQSPSTADALGVFPLGHDSMHNAVEKVQCSHEHVRSHRVVRTMHMMIKASAKYSLNFGVESHDILRSVLSTTLRFVDRQETTEGVSFKEKEPLPPSLEKNPAENSSAGSCAICTSCTTSLLSQIYNNLGIIAISRNDIREAEYDLQLAVRADSGNIDAIYNFCLLHIMLGQLDSAQTFWEESIDNCEKLKHILTSDEYCDSTCTVTVASLRNLNEVISL